MNTKAILTALSVFGKTWQAWRKRKADRRRENNETRAWLADWQCDKLNAALRDRIKYDPTIRTHHEGANPTTRIDLMQLDKTHKHKPEKPTKDGGKTQP